MKSLVINDIHLGAVRVAGTTLETQAKLKQGLQDQMRDLIMQHTDKHLIIPGDLFDTFTVDSSDVFKAFNTFIGWLNASVGQIWLIAGNHDIGKRSDKMSSFGLLSALLTAVRPDEVHVVDREIVSTYDNIHMIPHCMNQDLFNIELEKALDLPSGYLLLHANADNGFTEESDHSLNVGDVMMEKLSKKHTLMFAHEHQARRLNYGGKDIWILGNQWPSSISDCLTKGEAQKDGKKYAHIIGDGVEKIPTWGKDNYTEVEWTDLAEYSGTHDFIRVTGQASAAQASDVVSLIAKFRTKSTALVVGNAVKVEGIKGVEEMAEMSLESVTSYDVLGALLEMLEPAEQVAVKKLLETE